MAIKKVIDIIVNTGDAVKQTKNLDKSLVDLTASFEDVYGEIQPLSGRMGEMEDRMYELSLAGQTNSEEFKELAKEVGRYKKVIQDTDLVVDAMATTTGQKLGGALNGVTGGFALAQGAMGAFGVQSAGVEEALLKVQSAMAISQGLESVRESISSFKALGSIIGKTAIGQRLLTVAQIAGAVAMKVLNAVMSANPVFLLIAAFAALGAAIVYFSRETETAAEMNDRLNESLEKQRTALDKLSTQVLNQGKRNLELATAQGKSEKELHDIRMNNLERERAVIKANLETEKASLKDKRAVLKKALKDGDEETIKSQKDEIKNSQKRYNDLIEQNKDYNKNKTIENLNFDKEEQDRKDAEVEEAKAKNAERLDNYKNYLANRLSAEREIKDLELSLLAEGDAQKKAVADETFKRQIEDLKTNTALIAEEKAKLEILYKQQLDATILGIDKETRYKEIETEKAFQETLNAIKQEAIDKEAELRRLAIDEISAEQKKLYDDAIGEQAREYNAVNDKYVRLIDLANEYGLSSTTLEDARQKAIDDIDKKYVDEQKKRQQELWKERADSANAVLDTMSQGITAVGALNDLRTEQELANAEGNEAKQLQIQKKSFERNKKIQITMATISGIQGVINALTATSVIPDPFGMVLKGINAGIVGASTAINIAKIKSQTFGGGGGGGGASSSLPSQSVPNFSVVGAGGNNQIAESIANQSANPQKAYVVSGEVTSQQSLDRNRVDTATL